ncbi:MAG: GNAT family N-acetyltransferase [Candidatus Thermoplasmatota archaeon]
MCSKRLKIRKFEGTDYTEIVRLKNLVFPWINLSIEALRHRDENRAEKCEHQKYIAELDHEVIGYAGYSQSGVSYEPGKFNINGVIHPDHQAEGYGAEFYRHLMEELEEHDPVELWSHTKEGKERAIRFLEDRGFQEIRRVWELELDVDEFDEEPAGSEEYLEEKGIALTTLEEVGTTEENKRKFYDLFDKIAKDIPESDQYTGMDYEQFKKMILGRPIFSSECSIVAVKDNSFIGLLTQYLNEKENAIYTGLGGVKREHRRKGIATAMIEKAVEIAEEKGISKIKTESDNEGILHIIEKLGFEKKPGGIEFKKVLEG